MTTYRGERRRMTAMPLGGIGTGSVALAATGALRQWQLHNQGNHLGALPQSFFALRMSSLEPPFSEPPFSAGCTGLRNSHIPARTLSSVTPSVCAAEAVSIVKA